jgi:lysozyme
MSTLLNTVVTQLKQDEGLRLKPYKCTANKLTIGYGRNIEEKGITEEEANHLLLNDIIATEKELSQKQPVYNTLDDKRKEVLLNMCFQLGYPKLSQFKKFFKALENKNFKLASIEMMDSAWAKQTPNRAKRLSQQMGA